MAAHTLDLDRLLWVPGARKHFDLWTPPVRPLLSIEDITKEALRLLSGSLQFRRSFAIPVFDERAEPSDHFCVDTLDGGRPFDSRRNLYPAAAHISNMVIERGLRAFHVLPAIPIIPGVHDYESVVCVDAGSGIAMRGVRAYNIDQNQTFVRLEIAGHA